MSKLDPRITPARPDLAASQLIGQVEADRYAEPVAMQACVSAAPIRRAPQGDGAVDDQLLAGDGFDTYEARDDGWVWGQSRADGYVGWVEAGHLREGYTAPDHRITALRTYCFSRPDFKSAPRHLLSINASFTAGRREGRFVEAEGLGWVVEVHCGPVSRYEADFVAVAERFLGTPYLWGGKESLGLDCSGLVQMALTAAGIPMPRDADQQEAHLASIWRDVTKDPVRQRGDIVFWPGHVAIMTDADHMLHANAHTMDTTCELYDAAVARIREKENPVRSIFRPA